MATHRRADVSEARSKHSSTVTRRGAGVVFLSLAAILLSAVVLQVRSPGEKAEVPGLEELLAKSKQATSELHDYTGVLVKRELFDDRLVEQVLTFKFSRPFKVYVRFIEPDQGREGIYVSGWNQDRIRLQRGAPFRFSVNRAPRSRAAMKDNHHPITSFGLEQMLNLLTDNIQKGLKRGDGSVAVVDGGLIEGEPTWCIEIRTEPGEGRYVTVEDEEDLWQLAERAGQNMYVILHHNDDIRSPTEIRRGQKVFVPHHYASRGKYFISKRTFVTIKAVSWDHAGNLYESYHYRNLDLNPGLTDADFDPRSDEYAF